jgi:hypothetical protein
MSGKFRFISNSFFFCDINIFKSQRSFIYWKYQIIAKESKSQGRTNNFLEYIWQLSLKWTGACLFVYLENYGFASSNNKRIASYIGHLRVTTRQNAKHAPNRTGCVTNLGVTTECKRFDMIRVQCGGAPNGGSVCMRTNIVVPDPELPNHSEQPPPSDTFSRNFPKTWKS